MALGEISRAELQERVERIKATKERQERERRVSLTPDATRRRHLEELEIELYELGQLVEDVLR